MSKALADSAPGCIAHVYISNMHQSRSEFLWRLTLRHCMSWNLESMQHETASWFCICILWKWLLCQKKYVKARVYTRWPVPCCKAWRIVIIPVAGFWIHRGYRAKPKTKCAALLEQILLWFQEVELDSLSWYSHDGQSCNRNILKAPQSRDIQEGTVNRYISRIYNEGLSQVVSGLNCFLSLSSQVLILIPLFIPAPASYVSSILASFQLQLQTALESNNLKDIL